MPNRTATARALQPEPVATSYTHESQLAGMPQQGMLFAGVREEGLHLVRQSETQRLRREALARLSERHPEAAKAASRSALDQQRIPFPALRPDDPGADSGIYCDAPVAVPVHRALGAAIDISMVLLSLGLFVATLWGLGASVVLEQITAPVFVIAFFTVYGLYELMWALAGMDSVGMRWSGLRVVTFEGSLPDRERRLWRLIAFGISATPLGLGLLWSLVDEERLTWQDHMSKTFPTLRKARAPHSRN